MNCYSLVVKFDFPKNPENESKDMFLEDRIVQKIETWLEPENLQLSEPRTLHPLGVMDLESNSSKTKSANKQ